MFCMRNAKLTFILMKMIHFLGSFLIVTSLQKFNNLKTETFTPA